MLAIPDALGINLWSVHANSRRQNSCLTADIQSSQNHYYVHCWLAFVFPVHTSTLTLYMLHAGCKVAFNAFALFDGWGKRAPPMHAADTLVDDVLEAMAQAGLNVDAQQEASFDDIVCALQAKFMMALPQVHTLRHSCPPSSLQFTPKSALYTPTPPLYTQTHVEPNT